MNFSFVESTIAENSGRFLLSWLVLTWLEWQKWRILATALYPKRESTIFVLRFMK